MGEIKNIRLANDNFKNYIFNKNKTCISKELFEQMSEASLLSIAKDDDWGRWNQDTVEWLLKFLDKD